MAISVISVSSNSSEDSAGTPAGQVILFGTIPTTIPDTTPVITPPTTQTETTVIPTETPIIAPTIPLSPDYTPASPDYSPASETEFDPSEDPSSDHIPQLPATSPFLSSVDDTTDSDTPDTPPSPTHVTPFTEITASTQRSPVIPRRRVRVESIMHPTMPEDILEPAQEGAVEVTYETLRDLVQRFHDHIQAIPVHRIQVIEGVQREQGRRIVGVESAVTVLTERVAELEGDNRRLRGTTSVERNIVTNSRVTPSWREIVSLTVLVKLDSALTWWNSYKRTIGVDAAYAMKWVGLIKLMTEKASSSKKQRSTNLEPSLHQYMKRLEELQGLLGLGWCGLLTESVWIDETSDSFELTRSTRKANMYCPRNEIQKIETELWNLTVKGNDLTAYTKRLQDTICIANQLIDKKLQGYVAKSAKNKRRMESNPRDNYGQQPPFKRQNTIGNQQGNVCYECGRPRHFRKDCPKLWSQNHGNQTRNKSGNKTGGNKVIAKAYAISGGGTNLDSNVVTGAFLLNNCYASMLFDLGADRSFVLTTFSALLDVAPSTLDTSYAIELADGII
nr:hypothetical protein [Tanacetum cinerariifolium]